jgi:hypothetical protein
LLAEVKKSELAEEGTNEKKADDPKWNNGNPIVGAPSEDKEPAKVANQE